MRKAILWAVLGSAMLVPVAAVAQDRDHDERRYHDKRHRDDHQWNPREDRAWHMYWEQRHRRYIDWDRASERDRQRYWDWRHQHSDSILRIDIH